jgi:hypothetical protein
MTFQMEPRELPTPTAFRSTLHIHWCPVRRAVISVCTDEGGAVVELLPLAPGAARELGRQPIGRRLVGVGWDRGQAIYAGLDGSRLDTLWRLHPDRPALVADAIPQPIERVFRVRSAGIDGAAVVLVRGACGGTDQILRLDLRTLTTNLLGQCDHHLLDAGLCDDEEAVLWVAMEHASGLYRAAAVHRDGRALRPELCFKDSARAPALLLDGAAATAGLVADDAAATRLFDAVSGHECWCWDDPECHVDDIVRGADGLPRAWSEAALGPKRWLVRDSAGTRLLPGPEWRDPARPRALALVLPGGAGFVLHERGYMSPRLVACNASGQLAAWALNESGVGTHSGQCKRESPGGTVASSIAVDMVGSPPYASYRFRGRDSSSPLVVLIHGGPEMRDDGTFDPWIVDLVCRGATVVTANYPGSHGCGRATSGANRPWSVPRFVDWWRGLLATLIAAGVAGAATRPVVGGWSFGGYLALHLGACFGDALGGVFAISAPFDLRAAERGLEGARAVLRPALRRVLGDQTDADPLRLPVVEAKTLAAGPSTLIVVGDRDDRIGLDASHRNTLAFGSTMPNVRVLRLPRMGHFLAAPADRAEVLAELGLLLMAARSADSPSGVSVTLSAATSKGKG